MSSNYVLENPILWEWDVSREMQNTNNFKPRTTTLWDPSLPIETIPPIHIFAYFDEETCMIKIPKDWWSQYLVEYTEFHVREHVIKNVPKNTYAPLNQIYNMAWIHQYTVHLNFPKNNSAFVRDGVWSNHFMLSNDGPVEYGYSKVSVYLHHPDGSGVCNAPELFPCQEYYYNVQRGVIQYNPNTETKFTMIDSNTKKVLTEKERYDSLVEIALEIKNRK